MGPTRRHVIAGFAATALSGAASQALAQFRPGNGPRQRATPAVCLYSPVLIKIPYEELGRFLRGMGVDGCDLSVMRGGHINPDQSSVDMMRGVESITGVGLDVPVITTSYTSLADPTIRNVMAICGEMGVPVMRTGIWKYGAGDVEMRLAEVQRDLIGLMSLARAVNMALAIPNLAGENFGAAIWDTSLVIRGMDPRTVGFGFDPAQAAMEGAGDIAQRLALPKARMVSVRDFTWNKEADGRMKPVPCPLGEGVVDWPKFFGSLGKLKFNGPVSIHIDYQPKDELAAIKHDVDFVRKQIAAAYGTP
jgi:L-ribulose-5-phosphate 3-epimerase